MTSSIDEFIIQFKEEINKLKLLIENNNSEIISLKQKLYNLNCNVIYGTYCNYLPDNKLKSYVININSDHIYLVIDKINENNYNRPHFRPMINIIDYDKIKCFQSIKYIKINNLRIDTQIENQKIFYLSSYLLWLKSYKNFDIDSSNTNDNSYSYTSAGGGNHYITHLYNLVLLFGFTIFSENNIDITQLVRDDYYYFSENKHHLEDSINYLVRGTEMTNIYILDYEKLEKKL
jgi:hypothetical protein